MQPYPGHMMEILTGITQGKRTLLTKRPKFDVVYKITIRTPS